MILSSMGMLTGETVPTNEGFEEHALGGLWNPEGPTESATTHNVQPEEIFAAHPEPLPSYVDNSAGLPPVGNQQSQGSCTCWAIGYYHATYIENQESPFDLSDPENQVSPAFLYNVANGGFDGGSYMEDVADLIINNGAPSMAQVPYNPYDHTSWPAHDWIWVSGMKRKAVSQNWLYLAEASGMDALKTYLAAGNTATTGIAVYSNFDYIENFNYTYCASERYGTNRGGHIVTICGYDDDLKTADGIGAFRMVNSWGTGWGEDGYWWMSYEAIVDEYLGCSLAMYLESELNYTPRMVAKASINHDARGDITRNCGLEVTVTEDSVSLMSKPFLSCYWIEDWYGTNCQQYPFPEGSMAFDISEFLPSMNPTQSHDFILGLTNSGGLEGQVLSLEILNAEWWEGDISWETPLPIPAYGSVQTSACVFTDLFLHLPIRINSDLDLVHRVIGEFWEGSGTESNPYIIPNYVIWGENLGNCIYIANTTLNFVIENCTVEEASGGDWSEYLLDTGIYLSCVASGLVEGSSASGNLIGFLAVSCENVIFQDNAVTDNVYGIMVSETSDSVLRRNNISSSGEVGLYLDMSCGIGVYYNSFIDNPVQAYDDNANDWDDGYPSGGNYWSDYSGPDIMSGPLQDQPGSDGIGDIPYTDIDGGMGAQDGYPLMVPWVGESNQTGPVHNVDTGEHFDEIQTAIDDPDTQDGHTIEVSNGTYNENLVINKSLSLVGESRDATIINGSSDWFAISIDSNWVNISGFNIFTTMHRVVNIDADWCTISGNDISGSDWFGIYLNGQANNNIITHNDIYNCPIGICNYISDSNEISYNLFYNNSCAISMEESPTNIINNTFSQNGQSIYFFCSSDSTVVNNSFINNSIRGVYLDAYSDGNSFYHNNFIFNAIQAFDDGTNTWNDSYPSGGNYWSDYSGTDTFSGSAQDIPGADGIGDTPYTNIQGGTGAQDYYPLMEPWGPTVDLSVEDEDILFSESVPIIGEEITISARIFNERQDIVTFAIPVLPDWNFISIPLVQDDTDPMAVLDDNGGDTTWTIAKWFNPQTPIDPWKAYHVGSTVNDLLAINHTMGIWIYITDVGSDANLTVKGRTPAQTSIPLFTSSSPSVEGWNMVGYPGINDEQMTAGDVKALTGYKVTEILRCEENFTIPYQYMENYTTLNDTDYLNRGTGYWFNVSEDCTWTVDNGYLELPDAMATVSFYLDSIDEVNLIGRQENVIVPAYTYTTISMNWTVAGNHTIIVDVTGVEPTDRNPLNNTAQKALVTASTFTILLSLGWNLVSMPLVMRDTFILDVLAPISGQWDVVKCYDPTDAADPWKTFRPSGTANDLSTIDRTIGVWVHVTGNCTLTVTGQEPASTSITLNAGWNLVGYPSLTERVMSDALWGTCADRVEVFDPADPELLREMGPGEIMVPGMGYWVHVPVDSVWTVDW